MNLDFTKTSYKMVLNWGVFNNINDTSDTNIFGAQDLTSLYV